MTAPGVNGDPVARRAFRGRQARRATGSPITPLDTLHSPGAHVTLTGPTLEDLSALLNGWPPHDQRSALSRLDRLIAQRHNARLKIARRGRYLRIQDLATGRQLCLTIPTGS